MRVIRSFTIVITLCILLCSVAPLTVFAQNDSPQVLIAGDANGDGEVNTSDAVEILKQCVGLAQIGFYGLIAADMNDDRKLNTSDATSLLQDIITDADVFQPVEITGDIKSPVFYTDLEYRELAEHASLVLTLSEYTADAVESPHSIVSFGKGYVFELKAGKDYVFETCSIGGTDVDTMMYLIDDSGNVFLTDDNGGDGKYSRIEFHTWESSSYKLLVTGKSSNEIGSCRLSFGEHLYLEPGSTPQSVVPSSTPVAPSPTPTQTPSPTPTQTPTSGSISFSNQTVPEDGAVVQYKGAYSLKGTITADKPIVSVRADVVNKAGKVEKTVKRSIDVSLGLKRYSLTDGGATSIDGQMQFSALTIGQKQIKIYCQTHGNSEKAVFTGNFYVGATNVFLEGNAFAGSAVLSSSVRQGILDYINKLNEDQLTTKVIMEAFTDLGVPYGTGSGELDCSSYVQKAYRTVGISLPRTAAEQGRFCYNLNGAVSSSNRCTGDLVFFRSTGCSCGRYREIHHVALYLGTINGVRYFMEASSGKDRIVLRRAWGDGDTSGWAIEFYGRPY